MDVPGPPTPPRCAECGQTPDDRSAMERAGAELATWLDFYVNVCKATRDGEYSGYNEIGRKAIARWEALVPPRRDG